MFQDIALALPQYRMLLQTCRERDPHRDNERLLKLMALMCSDIIDFCQQIYCIFAHGPRNHRVIHRLRIVHNIIWKPFNKRFADLQVRIERRCKMFEREIQIDDQALLSQHFICFQKYLRDSGRMSDDKRAKAAREEKDLAGMHYSSFRIHYLTRSAIVQRVTQVSKWVGRTEYRHIYESTCSLRYPGTGMFCLDMPAYVQWRNGEGNIPLSRLPESDVGNWSQRFLSLQGIPSCFL